MKAILRKSEQTKKIDFDTLSEAAACCELAQRLGVFLVVTPDGKLSAKGNADIIRRYLSDISAEYRGRIVAHKLGLPAPSEAAPEVTRTMIAALDADISDYCTAYHFTSEERQRVQDARRRMPPALLVQNICAFRAWIFEAKGRAL